jgi:hypothetical protein
MFRSLFSLESISQELVVRRPKHSHSRLPIASSDNFFSPTGSLFSELFCFESSSVEAARKDLCLAHLSRCIDDTTGLRGLISDCYLCHHAHLGGTTIRTKPYRIRARCQRRRYSLLWHFAASACDACCVTATDENGKPLHFQIANRFESRRLDQGVSLRL